MKSKLVLLAAVLIAVCSAFTTARHSRSVIQNTYEFRGTSGQENDATKYWLVDGSTGHEAQYSCGGLQEILCKIQADPDPNNANLPDFSVSNPATDPDSFDMVYRPEEQ